MPNPHILERTFDFCNRRDYFDALQTRISTAKRRVLVTTMGFEAEEPQVARILDAMEKAAARGVSVQFAIDAYDFLVTDYGLGPLWWRTEIPRSLKGILKANTQALQRLQQAGVRCAITNRPARAFRMPFAGRSHIKAAIIDDYVFVGGCNLHKPEQLDLMAGWEDSHSADWLHAQLQKLIETADSSKAFGDHDLQYVIDDTSSILIDSGRKRQSLILEQALQTIDNARSWIVLTCQFFPNGRTAKHLKAAYDRGVKIYPIFNNRLHHHGVHFLIQNAIIPREYLRLPRSFFAGELPTRLPYLHAKVLATEQECMIGSHNFIEAGVHLGTAEIALRCRDGETAKQAVARVLVQTDLATTVLRQYQN